MGPRKPGSDAAGDGRAAIQFPPCRILRNYNDVTSSLGVLVGYGLDLDERERGRRELLAVDDLEAVRADPTLLDLPTRADDAWRPPRA